MEQQVHSWFLLKNRFYTNIVSIWLSLNFKRASKSDHTILAMILQSKISGKHQIKTFLIKTKISLKLQLSNSQKNWIWKQKKGLEWLLFFRFRRPWCTNARIESHEVILTKDDNSHEKSLLIDKVSQLPPYQCSGSLTAAYIEALALAKREINLLTTFDD